MARYVAVDIETTGLNKSKDRIVELAAIDLSQFINAEISQTVNANAVHLLLNPQKKIGLKAQAIHGISSEELVGKPTFADCHKEIFDFLKGAILVGHNVEFDVAFLTQEFQRCDINFAPRSRCTLRMARAQFKGLASYSLESLNEEFGLHQGVAHRALDDAITTAKLFVLMEKLKNQTKQSVAAAPNRKSRSNATMLGNWVGKLLRSIK